MEFFKIVSVLDNEWKEFVFNDKNVALEVFETHKNFGFVNGVRLYTCEFHNGALCNKEMIKEYIKK